MHVCRKRIKRGRSEELLEDTEANGNLVMEDVVKEDIPVAKETGNFLYTRVALTLLYMI